MAPLSIRASTVRFSTAAVSGFKRQKKKRKREMYTNLVILIMRLEGTPVLVQLSAGRDRSITHEGKVEAEADLLLRKKFFKNKQPVPPWIMATARFPPISKSGPKNNRKKEIVNGFNSPGITLADPCTGVSKYIWQKAIMNQQRF